MHAHTHMQVSVHTCASTCTHTDTCMWASACAHETQNPFKPHQQLWERGTKGVRVVGRSSCSSTTPYPHITCTPTCSPQVILIIIWICDVNMILASLRLLTSHPHHIFMWLLTSLVNKHKTLKKLLCTGSVASWVHTQLLRVFMRSLLISPHPERGLCELRSHDLFRLWGDIKSLHFKGYPSNRQGFRSLSSAQILQTLGFEGYPLKSCKTSDSKWWRTELRSVSSLNREVFACV